MQHRSRNLLYPLLFAVSWLTTLTRSAAVVNFVAAPAAVPGSTIVASAPLLVAAPGAVAVAQVATPVVNAPNGFYSSPTNPTVGYTCNNGYCYWTGTGDDSSNSGRVFCHRGRCFFTSSGSTSAANYGGLKCENGACYDSDKTTFGGSSSNDDKFCIDSYCFYTTYNQARYGYPWYSGVRWS